VLKFVIIALGQHAHVEPVVAAGGTDVLDDGAGGVEGTLVLLVGPGGGFVGQVVFRADDRGWLVGIARAERRVAVCADGVAWRRVRFGLSVVVDLVTFVVDLVL
jgi:hypothetical protein